MTFKRPLYRALFTVDGEAVEHVVDLRHGDRMRAELEANKLGLPPVSVATGQNHTTVMIWAALVREGAYKGACATFRSTDIIEAEPVIDPKTKQPAFLEVGPTRPGPSTDSDSPSTTTSPASTGSTPTPTTA